MASLAIDDRHSFLVPLLPADAMTRFMTLSNTPETVLESHPDRWRVLGYVTTQMAAMEDSPLPSHDTCFFQCQLYSICGQTLVNLRRIAGCGFVFSALFRTTQLLFGVPIVKQHPLSHLPTFDDTWIASTSCWVNWNQLTKLQRHADTKRLVELLEQNPLLIWTQLRARVHSHYEEFMAQEMAAVMMAYLMKPYEDEKQKKWIVHLIHEMVLSLSTKKEYETELTPLHLLLESYV